VHGGNFHSGSYPAKNMWIVHIKLPECGGEFPILGLIGNFRRRSVRSGFATILEKHSCSPTIEIPSWLTLNQSTSHLWSFCISILREAQKIKVVLSGCFYPRFPAVSWCFPRPKCSLDQSRRKRETWRLLVGISDFEVLSSMRSAQNTHISQKCLWKHVKHHGCSQKWW